MYSCLFYHFFFIFFQTFPWILNNFCFTNIFVKNPPIFYQYLPIFYQYFQYIHKIQVSIYPCLPIFQTMLSSTEAHVVLPTYEELWALQEMDWIYVLKMINLGLLWLDIAICLSFLCKNKRSSIRSPLSCVSFTFGFISVFLVLQPT